MRILGLIAMLVGLAVVFGYPSFHAGFSNFEIGKYTIFEKQNGFQEQSIWLTPEDMPIEVSFDANFDNSASDSNTGSALLVEIKDGERTFYSGAITFAEASDVQPTTETGSRSFEAKIQNLKVTNGALYTFSFGNPSEQPAATPNSITMTLTGIVTPANNNIPRVGYGLIGLGALSYLVGGRRSGKRGGNAPTGRKSKASRIGRRVDDAGPTAEKPKKETRRWGRGSDT